MRLVVQDLTRDLESTRRMYRKNLKIRGLDLIFEELDSYIDQKTTDSER